MPDGSPIRVAMRVDASTHIGTGHVMRCLSMGAALCGGGAEVFFLTRAHDGNLIDRIRERGFRVSILESKCRTCAQGNHYGQWLGTTWEEDASQTTDWLERNPVDWLVVDHYSLPQQWERQVRPHCGALLAIDDLPDRKHDCDILLDQNLQEDGIDQRTRVCNRETEILTSPRYALLSSAFAKARELPIPAHRDQPRKLVLFFGGSDPTNETAKVLDALGAFPAGSFEVDVVAGALNPNIDAIELKCRQLGFCVHSSADMARLYAAADLAFGAPGTSSWERLCMGIPSVLVSVAENQERIGEALDQAGCAFYLGRSSDVSARDYEQMLRAMPLLGGELRRQSRLGMAMVDGRGARRLASRMLNWGVELRPARAEDSHTIFEWRNSEPVRRWSFDSNPIEFKDHENWFARSLQNPDRILLVAQNRGEQLGVVRFDCQGNSATISIFLAPSWMGHGVGPSMLRNAKCWLRCERPQIKQVFAEVIEENHTSATMFGEAGYEKIASRYRLTL